MSFLFPFIWAVIDGTPDASAFARSMGCGIVLSILIGMVCIPLKEESDGLGTREAIVCVAFAWIAASFVGALPFIFSGILPNFVDAYFEAMSGFTTTGATVINELEPIPRGILMWRAQTQWLGGMGIVVLLIALIPVLGLNMTPLFKAESPGPKLEKTSPRIADMATTLWKIYMGITLVGIVFLMLGGMTFYNAVAHAFAAVSTGGYSTHTSSVAFYDSAYIEYVLTILMFISGVNFNLHFLAIRKRTLAPYKDSEFRFYLWIVLGATALIIFVLMRDGVFDSIITAFRYAIFQVVSVITTTGFVTADYAKWPIATQMTLLILMLVGGCAGSTSGAIKCVRFQLVLKEAYAELKRVIHPNAVIAIFQSGSPVTPSMIASSVCFICIYLIIWALSALAVSLCGYDIVTSISAVSATLSNVGPGLADVGPVCNFADQCITAKIIYIFDMLCGRLELYTILVLFTKDVWRK